MDLKDSTRLSALCDINRQKALEKAQRYNVPYYLDYHDMLKSHPEIDIISILTPSGLHAKHVIDLAQYNKHMIVEKPMALTTPDCDAMLSICREHGCRLFVVKQNRFNLAVQAARSALAQGRFGTLILGTVRVRWRRDQSYYDQAKWRGTWAFDGGVLSQQASHHIDLLQWFMGPVRAVQCQSTRNLLDIEAEDTAVAILKFESGALGIIEATVATRPNSLEASLSILGSQGSAIISGEAVNKVAHWEFQDHQSEDIIIKERCSEKITNIYGNGHLPFIKNVVYAIKNRIPGLVEAEEGKKAVTIMTALYESSFREGEMISPGEPCKYSLLGVHDSSQSPVLSRQPRPDNFYQISDPALNAERQQ